MVTLHQGWSTLQLGSTPEKGLCPMAFWQHQRICRFFSGERHSWNSGLHSHKESLALRRPNIGLWKMRAAISQPHIQFLAVSLRRTPGLAWVWFPHRGCHSGFRLSGAMKNFIVNYPQYLLHLEFKINFQKWWLRTCRRNWAFQKGSLDNTDGPHNVENDSNPGGDSCRVETEPYQVRATNHLRIKTSWFSENHLESSSLQRK